MTLGENIVRLRTEKGWTQDDLAERVLISRQSVSKWETNASVPELEKLLRLSQLFEISLDELVKGPDSQNISSADVIKTECVKAEQTIADGVVSCQASPPQRLIGFMLFGLGALILGLLTLQEGFFSGMLFSFPIFICSVICIIVKKRAGLWCSWFLCGILHFLSVHLTGITWKENLYWLLILKVNGNPERLIMTWIYCLFLFVMIIATLISYSKMIWQRTLKNRSLLLIGWTVFTSLVVIPAIIAQTEWYNELYLEITGLGFREPNYRYIVLSFSSQVLDAAKIILLVILLICTRAYCSR